ncbi:MAG: hypothetical protein ACT4O1_06705 [Gemmatimonadota bacterium]
MKRSISLLTILAITALAVFATPGRSDAAKSCIDQFYGCLNSASAYSGLSFHLAELECSLGYSGCLANKLKFW